MLAGFAVGSPLGVEPAWVAGAAAVVLAGHALARRRTTVRAVAHATHLSFAVFVLGLGVVVAALAQGELGRLVAEAVPDGDGLTDLLLVALVATVLANLVNNLPAILLLLPAATVAGPATVLAALIGVNVGPNLTYVGSLATLLWRRVLRERDAEPAIGEFLALGAVTVPAALVAATAALWVMLRVLP
jgi:arsenical pump membrane protein